MNNGWEQRACVRLEYEWPSLQSPGLSETHTYTSKVCFECKVAGSSGGLLGPLC